MRISIPKWYAPFDKGWKLCMYQKDDEVSKKILRLKEGDATAIKTFTKWSIAELEKDELMLELNYCIRSLGRNELTADPNKPLGKLAAGICGSIGIEYVPDLIAKRRATKHLIGMNKPAREAELDGVFYLNSKLKLNGKSILIVDDIKTSGTTTTFIRNTILTEHPKAKFYLFVLGENGDGNPKELIDTYNQYNK